MKIANPDRDLVATRFVGSRINQLLWERHLTKLAAAGRLGISTSTFAKKLRGHVPLTVDELLELSRLLEVEPHYLLPRLDSNQQPFVSRSAQVSRAAQLRIVPGPPIPPEPARVVDLAAYRAERGSAA